MNQDDTVPAMLRPLPLPEQMDPAPSRLYVKPLLVCLSLFLVYLLLKS